MTAMTGMTGILKAGDPNTVIPAAPARQRVLYIGGLGRSGSTLVERLVNEWPETLAVGETVHLWERGVRNRERCGCGESFDACRHWTAVGAEAFGGWEGVDLDEIVGLRWSVDRTRRLPRIERAHRRGRLEADQALYLGYLRRVLLAGAAVSGGAEVLVESSKHLPTAALLSLDPALDVRVLHLVRDPRGVAYSWTKEVARPETEHELMPTYSPIRTAGRWLSDNLGFEQLARRVPTLRMRYEDFLAEPALWLTRIGALVGIGSDELDLSYLDDGTARVATPMHSVAGNPLRFGGDDIRLRLDDAWRRSLPWQDRTTVTAITAPLLRAYRYPLRS